MNPPRLCHNARVCHGARIAGIDYPGCGKPRGRKLPPPYEFACLDCARRIAQQARDPLPGQRAFQW